MKWPIGKLKKYSRNPIITPSKSNAFECAAAYNATALLKDDKIHLFYRAEKHYYSEYISHICLATSTDGIIFSRFENNPVIIPELPYEERGCEDPRATKLDGKNFLTYVAFSGNSTHIVLAESDDLIIWRKKGVIMENAKSGALLSSKINDEYIMYFGDTNIYMATSKNLKDWIIHPEPILSPRKDHFDSVLVEIGPSPIITKNGIFMIYNSSNGKEYNVGYALFDKNNPSKLLQRSELPELSPTESWEEFGKVNYVVFAEGIVEKDGNYYIYYGGADKSVGVAVGKKIY